MHRPLRTLFPHLQPKWRTNGAPIPDSSQGRDIKAKSNMVPSNCWYNSWKAFSRKGPEAEKGQQTCSKWPKAARRAGP